MPTRPALRRSSIPGRPSRPRRAIEGADSPKDALKAVRLIIRLVVVIQSALQQLADLEALLNEEKG